MAKKLETQNRHCEECGKVVPVMVERLIQKNAGGKVEIDQEMSMKCAAGHYTNL